MLTELSSLWLPIVLSAVASFVYGFLAWVVLPHHRSDWRKSAKEVELLEALSEHQIPPGSYMFPYYSTPDEMKSEDYRKRWEEGPRGMLVIWDRVPNMGKNMALNFGFNLLVSFVIAYVGASTIAPGATFSRVVQVLGTVGILTYTAAGIPHAIWFCKKKSAVLNDFLDGIAYGLLIGAVFGWCWPALP